MQVILCKNYESLGEAMDVVQVKNGFARNYLIPNGIAVRATEGNRKQIEQNQAVLAKKEEKVLKQARQLAKKIEKVPCTIPVKVGEEDRLFGSVTNQDIAEFLEKEGHKVDKRHVLLEEPIKQLGVYTVYIELHKQVQAKLKVWVVKEDAEEKKESE